VPSPAAEVVPDPAELRPAQLPAGVGHFTGREAELAALTRAISRQTDEPRLLMVSGVCGIGKTALVVRWAHSVAERYPDGQIFVDLHGRTPRETLSARGGLGVALSALGVAKADLPAHIDERASLYRTLISGRRVLIVADDASRLDQLLALVPPNTSSQLVATSRRRLVGLAAHHAVQAFRVVPLSPKQTHELLAGIAGPERLQEPAAGTVVQWCGGWPLVTRLAGTWLAARPWQSMASLADELDDLADQILDEDPRGLRAALVSAHASLSPAAAYLLGRLGLSSSTTVNLHHPTPVAGRSVRRVRELLNELVAAHLMVDIGQDRFRIHDVVRRFARQCGAELVDRDVVDEWVRHRSATPADSEALARVADGAGRMADSHRI
jgi:hypothetical protein